VTLTEYVALINKLYHDHPELKELEVVYSRDDEGNGYDAVKFGPEAISLGSDGEPMESEPNRVCIN